VVAASVAVVVVHREVVGPLESVRFALERFADGSKSARARETGPSEVRAIAHVFNDMADRLVQQEEDQLMFLAGVTHALRDPLAALRLSVNRADAQGSALSPTEGARMVEVVKRQVQELDRMVADFWDTARIQAGRLDLEVEPRDLRALVE